MPEAKPSKKFRGCTPGLLAAAGSSQLKRHPGLSFVCLLPSAFRPALARLRKAAAHTASASSAALNPYTSAPAKQAASKASFGNLRPHLHTACRRSAKGAQCLQKYPLQTTNALDVTISGCHLARCCLSSDSKSAFFTNLKCLDLLLPLPSLKDIASSPSLSTWVKGEAQLRSPDPND